jgi:hypothetical protein
MEGMAEPDTLWHRRGCPEENRQPGEFFTDEQTGELRCARLEVFKLEGSEGLFEVTQCGMCGERAYRRLG